MLGDAIEKLRELPSESVHCVVTSPPYWGLRDYSRCSCVIRTDLEDETRTLNGKTSNQGDIRHPHKQNPNCPICHGTGIIEGVKEHQLGLEKTPEEYVQHLVEVFREVKRVLRGDGILFLNLGDSYNGSWGNSGSRDGGQRQVSTERLDRSAWDGYTERPGSSFNHPVLKPKDLVGIPWRVAFALQADGWYLRSDIIWSKPNPMPESVRDRPTKSHEYIFMLTKSARYFWDQEAVREPHTHPDAKFNTGDWAGAVRDAGKIIESEHRMKISRPKNYVGNIMGRNVRSVWEITTQPYPEAHFATFPEELPRRCIKAGTSQKGCCAKCGAPYERITEKVRPDDWQDSGPSTQKEKELRSISLEIYGGNQKSRSISDIFGRATKSKIENKGWQPTCECNAEITPCTVLDPFAGSGTTGWVARSLGRKAILIEINPVYGRLIADRTKSNIPDLIAFAQSGEVGA